MHAHSGRLPQVLTLVVPVAVIASLRSFLGGPTNAPGATAPAPATEATPVVAQQPLTARQLKAIEWTNSFRSGGPLASPMDNSAWTRAKYEPREPDAPAVEVEAPAPLPPDAIPDEIESLRVTAVI